MPGYELGQIVNKTGWVAEYTLRLQSMHGVGQIKDSIFFEVTVTEGGPGGGLNPETFMLPRLPLAAVDGEIRALTFGSVEMAMIATLKDAYINAKRVIVEGEVSNGAISPGRPPQWKFNKLTSVTIKDREGLYFQELPLSSANIKVTGVQRTRVHG